MSARSTYLELAASGLDVAAGNVAGLDPRCSPDEIAHMMKLLGRHQDALLEIIADRGDLDLAAVRGEASAR